MTFACYVYNAHTRNLMSYHKHDGRERITWNVHYVLQWFGFQVQSDRREKCILISSARRIWRIWYDSGENNAACSADLYFLLSTLVKFRHSSVKWVQKKKCPLCLNFLSSPSWYAQKDVYAKFQAVFELEATALHYISTVESYQ